MKSPLRLKCCVFLFLFLSSFSFGQLSNFSLTVTPTNETCTANGSLNFNVSNTTSGATIVYTIYYLPNTTTPISVQNTTSFSGLVAGNYRIVALQSFGGQTSSQQQDVTIVSLIVLLTYQLSGIPANCNNNGQITVAVTSGVAVSYEIFAGPIIKPLQTSNIFTGMIAGQYQVRVFDACGEGVVQTFTLLPGVGTGVGLQISGGVLNIDCTTSFLNVSINASATTLNYPLTVTITVQNTNGGSLTTINQLFSSSFQAINVLQNVLLHTNDNYHVTVHATDGCGNTYDDFDYFTQSGASLPNLEAIPSNCNASSSINIYNALASILLYSPVGYAQTLPYTLLINNGVFTLSNVIPGTYTFYNTSSCGVQVAQSIYVGPPSVSVSLGTYSGCDVGFGGISGSASAATLVSAPQNYPNALPQNLTSSIIAGHFSLPILSPGIYTFLLTDSCGVQHTNSVVVEGYYQNTTVNIIPNCGSFDIDLQHNSNNFGTYFLQIFNTVTNIWEDPNPSFRIYLTNNAVNYNYAYTGVFRIVKQFSANSLCQSVIYQFEYTGQPKINDVYSFLCNNNTYDVFVDAIGMPPLTYRITKKNGIPFFIQNGNSSIFLGLQAAVYNFQVEDSCGNILNSIFEVPRPFNLNILASGFCSGTNALLSLPNFSIFQYQWWKDNNTTSILSTTNSLQFPSFNPVTNAGVYHVRFRYTGNPNSCIDFVLDYDISAHSFNPNAGLDGAISYCGNQGSINLFSLLQGNYDSGGTWNETTSSGNLNNNLWDSSNVTSGTYHFQYHVDGLCSSFDDAMVSINIKPIPQTPTATINPIVCDTHNLNLFATTIPNAIYNWSGPNNFSSNEQNPIINPVTVANNGVYTVNITQNGCVSGFSSVNVNVGLLPDFSINASCLENKYIVVAAPISNSFVTNNVNYSWSGPNGYSSSENPIDLTNKPKGIYNLTITSSDGCSSSNYIDIKTTLCVIPNVVMPNNNMNSDFDLSGLDINNLEIYNRWGKLVYNKENYTNQWHGQNNNDGFLPDGTYFYLIKLNNSEDKTGWVYLLK